EQQGQAADCDQEAPAREVERKFRHAASVPGQVSHGCDVFAPIQRQLIETPVAGALSRTSQAGRGGRPVCGSGTIAIARPPARGTATAIDEPPGPTARPFTRVGPSSPPVTSFLPASQPGIRLGDGPSGLQRGGRFQRWTTATPCAE